MIDLKIRNRAQSDLSTSFSVEAGAGTGKTTLLTSRYVELVKTGRATPSRIAAITFTENAALELQTRVRDALLKLELHEAIQELDRAPISTIHSFAASLLRERPLEAHLDPNFTLMDELSLSLFLEDAYRRWLGQALESDQKRLSRALAAGIGFERIAGLAELLYKNRDLLDSLTESASSFRITTFFEEVQKEVEDLRTLALKACTDPNDEGYQAIESLYGILKPLRDAGSDLLERALLLRLSVPTTKGNQSHWSPKETLKDVKARMTELSARVKGSQLQIRQSIFQDLVGWLKGYVHFVEQEKSRKGELDFDDLLLSAVELLRQHPDVRDYFRKRYSYLLVDEFQDTDPIQTELIWWLASDEDSHKGTEQAFDLALRPGKLFLVGDPKQSIYRFRRADIEVYRTAAESLLRNGEHLLIRQNFRSSKPLIDWINRAFNGILGSSYAPIDADPEHAYPTNQKPVVLIDAPAISGRESSHDVRRLEAEAVAGWILRALDGGLDYRVMDPKSRQLRSPRSGDIALLFPTTTEIDRFEEQLRRASLPFSLEGGRLFFARTEIHAAIALLDAIASPTDSIAVVAALKSSLLGHSDEDLRTISISGQPFDYRVAKRDKLPSNVRRSFDLLLTLHQASRMLSPSDVLTRLLEETLAFPMALHRFHGEHAASNLERLVTLCRTLESRGVSTLRGLITWLQDRAGGDERQDESVLSDESGERIKLMTVHKAKGLEFPIVVLANLAAMKDRSDLCIADRLRHRLALGIGSEKARFATSNFEELQALEKVQRQEERKRILYVAATRARDLLVIPWFAAPRSNPELHAVLENALLPDNPYVERLSADRLSVVESLQPATPEKAIEFSQPFDVAMTEIDQRVSARISKFRKGISIVSPTSLVEHAKGASVRRGDGIQLGSMFHAVMERIPLTSSKVLDSLLLNVALEFDLPGPPKELGVLVGQVLKGPLWARIQKAKKVYREVPFSIVQGEDLMEGMMDLVLEEEDGLIILDYKTDRVAVDEASARASVYAPQLRVYTQAVQELLGIKAKETLAYFVRPNVFVPIL